MLKRHKSPQRDGQKRKIKKEEEANACINRVNPVLAIYRALDEPIASFIVFLLILINE